MADEELAEKPEDLPSAPEQRDGIQMPFLDHLEELRWCILKSLLAVLVGAIVCLIFAENLLSVLTAPYEEAVQSLDESRPSGAVAAVRQLLGEWTGQVEARPPEADRPVPPERKLQMLKVMTSFFVRLQIGFFGGLVLALPFVFYQAWQFVAPGLLPREQRLVVPIVLLSAFCFAVGAALAYWIVLPMGLRFFLGLEPPDMTSRWAVDEYIGFVLRLIMGFGIVFEMPVVTLFLSRLGLVTPAFLRRVRRYAIVVVFALAAIFTPPDPFSQIMMALPLLVLYEISIWVCQVSRRKRESDSPPGE